MKHTTWPRMIAVLALTVFALPVLAQSSTSTIRKIKETRTVTIGYREAVPPVSYEVDGKPMGYSVEICERVADKLKTILRVPDLKVNYLPVDSTTRFSSIIDGQVDLECGVTTNNFERQRKAAFSVTTFVAGTRLLSRSSRIRILPHLKNKRVVVQSDTTNRQQLIDFNERYRYNMTILEVLTEAEAMQMVRDGQADAYSTDDIILAGLAANEPDAKEWQLSVQSISMEPYGMMMRRGDPAFKRAVDDAIISMFRSGEIHRLYDKWFMLPIPPKGVVMNLPMSDALKNAIKKPTDSGNPAYYH